MKCVISSSEVFDISIKNISDTEMNITVITAISSIVKIQINQVNYTMQNLYDNVYNLTYKMQVYGLYTYKVYVNDKIGIIYSTDKDDYYNGITDNIEFSGDERGLNNSLSVSGYSTKTTGWYSAADIYHCFYSGEKSFKGGLSIVCTPGAQSRSISIININDDSFTGQVGLQFFDGWRAWGEMWCSTAFYDTDNNLINFNIDMSQSLYSCDKNNITTNHNNFVKFLFDWDNENNVLFYINDTLCKNYSNINGINSFGFYVYSSPPTVPSYAHGFDDFFISSGERVYSEVIGTFSSPSPIIGYQSKYSKGDFKNIVIDGMGIAGAEFVSWTDLMIVLIVIIFVVGSIIGLGKLVKK